MIREPDGVTLTSWNPVRVPRRGCVGDVPGADSGGERVRVPGRNRARHQDRFKAHVSFEPEAGLFTAVELTGGTGAAGHEAAVAVRLLAGEQDPATVLGDAAYGTGDLRRHL